MHRIYIHAFTTLRKTVFSTVNHTPLDRVIQVRKAGQHNGEIAAALRRGTFEQAVDVLEQDVAWFILQTKKTVDVPPEDTFFTLDAARLGKRLGDRVILTGKTTDNHVDIGDGTLARLVFIQNLVDVLIY